MESVGQFGQLLGKLLAEEYLLLSGIGGDVAKLQDDLDTMNTLRRMLAEAEDGSVDYFASIWVKQLRELTYDSEDYIDLYMLRIKSTRPNDGVRASLGRLLTRLSARHRLAVQIRALRARATAIVGQTYKWYGINRNALRCSTFLPPVLSSSSLGSDSHRLIGIEDQAITLAERLKKTRSGESETGTGELNAVFSVVGFGGLGKTTLARRVCRIVEADFPFQAMVAVSEAFEPTRDLKPLLKRLLQQVLTCRTDNEMQQGGLDGDIDRLDVDQLAKKLEQGLEGKRFLIVIDNVWTVRAWEAIQSRLPENKCGSIVLVTTRIQSVAKACSLTSASEEYIYHVRCLSLEDSRKLFLSRAFGSTDAQCPNSLEEAMKSILRKCGGMPLAIISIASVLASYTSPESKEKWDTICRSLGSQMEMHPTLVGMSRILTLSYNHLPQELKFCMLYLSIFPEGYAIRKDRLLHRWIAEGLIPKKRGLTMLEVAESYFKELLSRNMILSVQGEQTNSFDYDGMQECCQVHDMLLDVIVSKSLEYNFVTLLGGQYKGVPYKRIHRLSIHEGRMHIRTNMQQHVRSLSLFQMHESKLLDQLGNFTLLRVLDLEDCKGVENKHVRYACQLHLLKFLSFRGTNISEVPRQINNLEHLQTLDLRYTRVGVLTTVTELEKLERLYTTGTWLLPKGLSRMKALREVGFADLDNVEVAGELGKLEQMQELVIRVNTGNICEDAEGKEAFAQEVANSLSNLYSLRSLVIGSVSTDALDCLHHLQAPPRLLRHLCISGTINYHQFPTWVGSLTYLVEIILQDVRNLHDDEPFGVLSKLPSLQSVKMVGPCYYGEELVARSSHNFPALVNLAMDFCDDTPQAYRFEAGSMPNLQKLTFRFINSNTVIVTGIEHLTRLREVQLSYARTDIVEQFKAESGRREAGSSQFQVIVKY